MVDMAKIDQYISQQNTIPCLLNFLLLSWLSKKCAHHTVWPVNGQKTTVLQYFSVVEWLQSYTEAAIIKLHFHRQLRVEQSIVPPVAAGDGLCWSGLCPA